MSDERQEPTPETQPTIEVAPSAAEPPVESHLLATIVDQWFQNHIVGSPLGRSTEAWNHLQTVLPILKEMLAKAM